MKVYYGKDIDGSKLKSKKVAIFGFGSQGHAHSQNLRDSGVEVLVVENAEANRKRAIDAGLKVVSSAEAVKAADVIMMLVPDEMQGDIYRAEIAPHLSAGKTVGFAHGFNIHFGQIVAPANVNVIMVAPKGPGHLVRSEYKKGSGVPCLVAVHQDPSGDSLETALAYAWAIGGARAGVLQTTFKDECETDLFGEQVVLCGGLSSLIFAAYDTLIAAGYPPEMAYFECCHEVKLIADLIYQHGISQMRYSISNTAKYGDITRGPRIITDETRKEMKKILDEIQTGKFAKEWILETKVNRPVFNALLSRDAKHPIEEVGARLRSMMPWLNKDKLIDE